jgi:hypothetical protein
VKTVIRGFSAAGQRCFFFFRGAFSSGCSPASTLLHHPLEPAPCGLGAAFGRPPALRLHVTHDVIHVDIFHRRGVFRVLFLKLIRFGFLAHAQTASRDTFGIKNWVSTTRGL